MSWLSRLMGSGQSNPANKAMPYLNQIPGVAHQTYDPYIQRGQKAGDIAQGQFDQMSQDPMAFINKLMEGYKPSESYKFQQDELGRGMASTAAAGGMRGTPQDQEAQAKLTQGLLSGDMQQWLQNLLGAQATGLQGEQNMYNTGATASGAMGGDIMNALGTQGSLAFQGQANKNQSANDLFKALMGGMGAIGTAPMTGGGSLFGKIASKWM